jgi:hypothetical protein
MTDDVEAKKRRSFNTGEGWRCYKQIFCIISRMQKRLNHRDCSQQEEARSSYFFEIFHET